jgi:hypothetical protein
MCGRRRGEKASNKGLENTHLEGQTTTTTTTSTALFCVSLGPSFPLSKARHHIKQYLLPLCDRNEESRRRNASGSTSGARARR